MLVLKSSKKRLNDRSDRSAQLFQQAAQTTKWSLCSWCIQLLINMCVCSGGVVFADNCRIVAHAFSSKPERLTLISWNWTELNTKTHTESCACVWPSLHATATANYVCTAFLSLKQMEQYRRGPRTPEVVCESRVLEPRAEFCCYRNSLGNVTIILKMCLELRSRSVMCFFQYCILCVS